jgi:hypothetical protein
MNFLGGAGAMNVPSFRFAHPYFPTVPFETSTPNSNEWGQAWNSSTMVPSLRNIRTIGS